MDTRRNLIGGLLLIVFTLRLANTSIVSIDTDGGYKNIFVAIHDGIPEDKYLLQNIRKIFLNASEFLYTATKGKAYFKEVFIAVPTTWTDSPHYEKVSGNYFSSADIRIDNPNPEHGEAPYTLQPGECGEPGQYIHLTPSFVREIDGKTYENFGDPGRQLVHEWAHLRYGVFDEYGIPGDSRYPMFYTENGRVRPTTCIRDIEGWIESKSGGSCSLVEGKVDKNCIFIPDIRGQRAKASIMYMPFIPSIEGFCDESEVERYHNSRAPTKQNAMCNYRSTLDVIFSHPDFRKRENPSTNNVEVSSNPRPDTRPRFRTIRSTVARYVLLLDVSGSMRGRPMELLYRSALRFLDDRVPDGSYIGLVQFSTGVKILQDLTRVDEESRRILRSKLPNKDDNGSTAIGKGLKACLEVLRKDNNSAVGGMIILITDGEENVRPMIEDVLPDVLRAEVRVNTVAFGNKATVHLERLTKLTGGRGYFFADIRGENPATAVDSAFLKSVTAQADIDLQPVEIAQTSIQIDPGTNTEKSVIIDKELGKNMVFSITSSNINAVDITLTSPSGKTIGPGSTEYQKDTTGGMRILVRLQEAESGTWKMKFSNSDGRQVAVSYDITSEPRDPREQPVRVRSWFSELQLKVPARAKIFAEVKKGYNAVIGATVVALVERPMGKSVEVHLKDNGAGADATPNDGIYTTYFTNFNGNGRYAVLAHVLNDGSARLKTGSSSSGGIRIPTAKDKNELFSRTPTSSFGSEDFVEGTEKISDEEIEEHSVPADSFERVSDAGAFRVEDWVPEKIMGDKLPPNRIIDLEIVKTDDSSGYREAVLRWTSPGNDFDYGQATALELRASLNHDDLVRDFDNSFIYKEHWLQRGSLTPVVAGVVQEVHVIVPVSLMLNEKEADDNNQTKNTEFNNSNNIGYITDVYFAVRALDEAGNAGQVSNIATANYAHLVAQQEEKEDVNVSGEQGDNISGKTISEKPETTEQSGEGSWWPLVRIILGILIGLAVFMLFIIIVLAILRRRHKRRARKSEAIPVC